MGVLDPRGEDRSCKRCIASPALFPSGSPGLVGGCRSVLIRHVIYWLKVDFIPECARKKKKEEIDRVAGFL